MSWFSTKSKKMSIGIAPETPANCSFEEEKYLGRKNSIVL
jgi:hypothetical protein